MPEWDITATTVHCDAVNDEVTILITADATATCTGRETRRQAGKRQRKPTPCGDGTCAVINETIERFTA